MGTQKPIVKHSTGEDAPTCDDGWTPLHEAAARGLMDTTRLLVEHGARLDIKNKGA